jgi:hypothetical protein
VLWRIALNDMLDMHGKVIVLERGPRDVTEQLENALICDDGQDLLPVLLKILAPRPRDLHVTVAWTPLGTSDDVAMMHRCPYLHSFPQKHRGIATVLTEDLNRRNELAE